MRETVCYVHVHVYMRNDKNAQPARLSRVHGRRACMDGVDVAR